jgi:NAD(P)-dependent dehydrogenase (short-subunit alcohol dehydrogenase family)
MAISKSRAGPYRHWISSLQQKDFQIMSSQHAIVVGGSSGIGLATAKHLIAKGYRVTITGRDRPKLDAAQAALGDVETVAIDATNQLEMRELFGRTGGFDHLVLAFGSRKGVGPFASIDIANVREGFEEKVYPQFASAQAALPFLNKGGSITFISAVSAEVAMPGTAGIGAANAAVAMLVPTLAAELKPLRVNGVSPGVIDTPWWDFLPAEQKQAAFADFAQKTPVGRIGRPEDIADTIGFLIGNSFMTGHMIICDGGARLGNS